MTACSIDLITALKVAGTIRSFITSSMSEVLCELNLNAAQTALSNFPLAKNKNAHIRHVITHLQAADEAIIFTLFSPDMSFFPRKAFRTHAEVNDLIKKIYIKSLLALCYKFVGETELMNRELNLATEFHNNVESLKHGWTYLLCDTFQCRIGLNDLEDEWEDEDGEKYELHKFTAYDKATLYGVFFFLAYLWIQLAFYPLYHFSRELIINNVLM